MGELWRDVRYGVRLLWKSVGFTSVSLLALALGIGATTAIFSLLYAVLLAPLPYPDSDRVMMVWSHQKGERNGTSPSDYLDWKKESKSFEALNAWTGQGFTMVTDEWTEQVQASQVGPAWFDILFGEKTVLGRHFVEDDGLPGNDHVVILNNKFWKERFGSDPTVVGRKLRMSGELYTVIGVAAPSPSDVGEAVLSVPLAFKPEQITREAHYLLVIGRLKRGVTVEAANAEMSLIAKRLTQEYPKTAWHAARQNVSDLLKEGGRTTAGAGSNRLRRVLVVAEFALALILVAGAGLILRSFWNVTKVDLGIRRDHVLTFNVPIQNERTRTVEQIRTIYRQLEERVAAVPGVAKVAIAPGLPAAGAGRLPFSIVGQVEEAEPSRRPQAVFMPVTPGYYDTYGIRLVRGRFLDGRDLAGGQRVAMVSESFARQYLSGVDPLTQRVKIAELVPSKNPPFGDPVEWQIVGVFHDVQYDSHPTAGSAEADVPFDQSPWPYTTFGVRTAGDPAAVTKSIAAAVRTVNPDYPMTRIRTMDQVVSDSLVTDRFVVVVFGSFAGLALLLAAIGIYGVMTFSVAQRNHEMGIRIALGAGDAQVLRLVVGEGMWAALIGMVIGLPGVYLVGKTLKGLLYNVGAMDVRALAAVGVVLLAAALLACYVPARRATKIDPIGALRQE